jgi:hypothetical protein
MVFKRYRRAHYRDPFMTRRFIDASTQTCWRNCGIVIQHDRPVGTIRKRHLHAKVHGSRPTYVRREIDK